MITLIKLDKYGFANKKFDFIVDEHQFDMNDAYHAVEFRFGDKIINVGIKSGTVGIDPQVELYREHLLIGMGGSFNVYKLNGELVKSYEVFYVFHEFLIKNECILVVGELGLFLLNSSFEKKWEKDFNEIIGLIEVKDNFILLEDFNGKKIKLNFNTGTKIK
ncbi:MAG: hypothetical protein FWE16_04960 [Firmicutes bacterium]|nr:hypothetical protein [Bacillota bacterium]